MSNEKEIEMDSQCTASGSLSIYSATKHQSAIRLENYSLDTTILYIHEKSLIHALKFDWSTLLALRNVLNRWHEDEIIKRGNK